MTELKDYTSKHLHELAANPENWQTLIAIACDLFTEVKEQKLELSEDFSLEAVQQLVHDASVYCFPHYLEQHALAHWCFRAWLYLI